MPSVSASSNLALAWFAMAGRTENWSPDRPVPAAYPNLLDWGKNRSPFLRRVPFLHQCHGSKPALGIPRATSPETLRRTPFVRSNVQIAG